jgi:hypothetical protein
MTAHGAPAPPPVQPPAAAAPARRPWYRKVIRAVGLGTLSGLAVAFSVVFWVSSNVGPAPARANVCREVPVPVLGEQRLGVELRTVCTDIDVHLSLPLGGTDGFEGAFQKPMPPSDPAEPRPEYLVWDSDGCSAPVLGAGPFDFTLACSRHDFGWRNLKAVHDPASPVWHVGNKDRVDAGFLYDMRVRCSAVSAVWRIGCDTTARVYYTAVRLNPSGVEGLPGRGG